MTYMTCHNLVFSRVVICHCETNWIGCGASYGCTQRAESGAAMSHYLCDLIPRCAGFLGAMKGLHIHIWDCLMIFRSPCWSICDTASCHRLLCFQRFRSISELGEVYSLTTDSRGAWLQPYKSPIFCASFIPSMGLRHHKFR